MYNYLSFITRTDKETNKMTSPEGKRRVFISYRHSDEESLALCPTIVSAILEKLDVAIWQDSQLSAGVEYDVEIEAAITSSDAFVLLLTPTILDSKYIREKEIATAIRNKVPILPIIAGISHKDVSLVESIVGSVHMAKWFYGKQEIIPQISKEALEQFINGLKLCIASKELILQATMFYEKGNEKTSLRYLSPEQVFIKAYGCLFGLTDDAELGVRLMDSILQSYGSDDDFIALKRQVEQELISHFYRTNQPELFFSYMNSAISNENKEVALVIKNAFATNWHKELLKYETELSFYLLKYMYSEWFEEEWDSQRAKDLLKKQSPIKLDSLPLSTNAPPVCELYCDEHVATLQGNSTTGDVDFTINGYVVDSFYLSCSPGTDSAFLAYDSQNKLFLVLTTDFDHYGPETGISVKAYSISGGEIKKASLPFIWIRGLRVATYPAKSFFN